MKRKLRVAAKKKTSVAIQNPLNPSPMQPEELKYNTDITPKINSYEYAVEDLRSRVLQTTTTVQNFSYYNWNFEFELSQEEVQFIYFSNSWAGPITTDEASYPPYYIMYIDDIKYVKVYYSGIANPDDFFINLLNSIRVLTQKKIRIEFYQYVRANFVSTTGTITLSVKSIR